MRMSAPGAALLVYAIPTYALAQAAELRVRENVRAEPGGEVIAVMDAAAALDVVSRRGAWIEVALEGWIWARSLQLIDRGGYDLVVSAPGENVRARPAGAILGRVERGTLLEEVERIPGWIRVRRVAWIWGPSVSLPEAGPADDGLEPAVGPSPEADTSTVQAEARSTGSAGAAILASPSGDTLARTSRGTELQVVAREGDWARVRLEGWTFLPDDPPSSDVRPTDVAPSELIAEPERYRGQVVLLRLQFLSVERAESVRIDFQEGEAFLLTRHVSGNYVYVALAPELVDEALALAPLERITVVGRVRTPSSALTGSPILDLIELERAVP